MIVKSFVILFCLFVVLIVKAAIERIGALVQVPAKIEFCFPLGEPQQARDLLAKAHAGSC